MNKPRFVVRSVTGWAINASGGVNTSGKPPGTDFVVLDRGNCARIVGRFPAQLITVRKGVGGGTNAIPADERKRMAEALAARLEREYADPA